MAYDHVYLTALVLCFWSIVIDHYLVRAILLTLFCASLNVLPATIVHGITSLAFYAMICFSFYYIGYLGYVYAVVVPHASRIAAGYPTMQVDVGIPDAKLAFVIHDGNLYTRINMKPVLTWCLCPEHILHTKLVIAYASCDTHRTPDAVRRRIADELKHVLVRDWCHALEVLAVKTAIVHQLVQEQYASAN